MNPEMIAFNSAIGIGVIIFLWMVVNALKLIWKLTSITVVFVVLLFFVPAAREWILGLF